MAQSRRTFLAGSAAIAAVGATPASKAANPSHGSGSSYSKLAAEIVALFAPLPGSKSIKIVAPAIGNRRAFAAELDPGLPLFCASSFKGYVLGEALRQNEASNGDITKTMLALDESVWSLDSAVFNPPYLSGRVSERTALEAMVSHSDNTGADMVLRHIGADNVRSFIAAIGLSSTRIPNSTRQFLGYIFGVPDWQQTSWVEAVAAVKGSGPLAHRPINDVQTMVSSASDFVSFYSRGLQGAFFKNAATLAEFRAILMIADAIPQVIPLGATGFAKGGQINLGAFNGLCLAGGMYFPDRWVYFATMINWENADPGPTTLAFVKAIARAFVRVKEVLSA
jgi:beta-lactamase class A